MGLRRHNKEGRGEVAIIQGRRGLDTMRGGKEKYNNQQWLMGDEGGKRMGGVIAMKITASNTTLTMTACTTKGSGEENDTINCPVAAAVFASHPPPSPCVPYPLPLWWLLTVWWLERWLEQWRWRSKTTIIVKMERGARIEG
jgi:hypothetical protein